MGRVVIVRYVPKPGRDDDLRGVLADRLPLLRSLGLATDREHTVVRAKDGSIIEVSEWVSDEAIGAAHSHPKVLELWARFDDCCTYVPLQSLDESADMFATFDPVDL